MSDLRDALRSAGRVETAPLEFGALRSRIRARRRRRRIGGALGVCGVLAAAVAATVAIGSDDGGRLSPVVKPTLTFPVPTSAVPLVPTTTATSLPATSAVPTDQQRVAVTVTVLDGSGQPFPAGVAFVGVCRDGLAETACANEDYQSFFDSEGDGTVEISLAVGHRSQVYALVKDIGWPDPDFVDPDGVEYHFSDTVGVDVSRQGNSIVYGVTGDTNGTWPTLTIFRPDNVQLRVVDGTGQPFAPGVGGVKACVVDASGTCPKGNEEWRVAYDTDGDGTVEVGLDPDVDYEVQGIAVGAGWCNPWISPDGKEWHFGTMLSPVRSDALSGHEFVVTNPCP